MTKCYSICQEISTLSVQNRCVAGTVVCDLRCATANGRRRVCCTPHLRRYGGRLIFAATLGSTEKSFLVLFFKKELLSFLPLSRVPPPGNAVGHQPEQVPRDRPWNAVAHRLTIQVRNGLYEV